MPTMPLNQIAFLSEWPAFRTVKRAAARHHRCGKKSPGFHPRNRSRGGFPRRRELHFESLPGWSSILLLLLVSSNTPCSTCFAQPAGEFIRRAEAGGATDFYVATPLRSRQSTVE